MSRRRRKATPQTDMRQIVREELSKALALPAGAQATEVTAGYLQQLQANGNPRISGASALPRDPYNNIAFGPGEPLFPAPISPLLPTGRPAPRRWEYPVSWNLQTTTTRAVPWMVLRDAADNVSIVRSCIEVCKSALTGLDWGFSIDSGRARALAKRSGTSNHEVIVDLQDKFADDIDRLHQWWARPARGWTFTEWLGAVLEDELVYDAVALYPRFGFGGDLLALEHVDSSTIKPLLDDRGDTPIPPLAAYQQILWGFPRGDYAASPEHDVDGEYAQAVYGPLVVDGARTDTLIYKVRNRRSRGPYGFSCVEQALPDIDLWLKRWEWLRAEYTAGVLPQMITKVDASMTPEQMREWQSILNDALSGNTSERHRAQFFPSGFEPIFPAGFEAKFANDIDLHLIRLICAAFDILPTSLGFTPNHGMGGMGGQGHQQGEQDQQLQRGTKPRAKWIVDLVNEVSRNYLDMPPEVSFCFHGIDEQDEQKEAQLLEGYLKNGGMVLNEVRDRLNLPRYTIEQANEPFIATPTGPAFFNPTVQPVGMPGNLPSHPGNNPAVEPPQEPAEDPSEAVGAERKAEQKAFLAFVAKSDGGTDRPFRFDHHPSDVADAANKLAAAGDLPAIQELFRITDG